MHSTHFIYGYNITYMVSDIMVKDHSDSERANYSFYRHHPTDRGTRCSSVVRAFAHGSMGRRIDPSWGGPIELFLVPANAPRLF